MLARGSKCVCSFLASAAFYRVGSAPVLVRELADGARTRGRDSSLPFKQDRRGKPVQSREAAC